MEWSQFKTLSSCLFTNQASNNTDASVAAVVWELQGSFEFFTEGC